MWLLSKPKLLEVYLQEREKRFGKEKSKQLLNRSLKRDIFFYHAIVHGTQTECQIEYDLLSLAAIDNNTERAYMFNEKSQFYGF
jgi:hypothetical protein